MKTDVIMESTDRELFGIKVRQNTKESFFSINDLQDAYDKARWVNGWTERKVGDILNYDITKHRIYYLLKLNNTIDMTRDDFLFLVKQEGIVKTLKELGRYKTTGARKSKEVMCDQDIWFLLAMELNPMIYAIVAKWAKDSLIFDRIEAGTEFLPMNSAIKRLLSPKTPDYAKYAREINVRVFGFHQTRMRNLASAKELRVIAEIEKAVTKGIERSWIKNEEELLDVIRTY